MSTTSRYPFKPAEVLIEMWPTPATRGMHVGMPTGVKVTHRPTGLIATSQDYRSQHRNREAALGALADMLNARVAEPSPERNDHGNA